MRYCFLPLNRIRESAYEVGSTKRISPAAVISPTIMVFRYHSRKFVCVNSRSNAPNENFVGKIVSMYRLFSALNAIMTM